jgi:hypothetical protein
VLVFFDFWTGDRMLGLGSLVGVPVLLLVFGVISWLGSGDE